VTVGAGGEIVHHDFALGFGNVAHPPLDDVRVRRALALAVDRRAIVEKILRGDQLPASAFTPPGMAGYTPPAGLATDFCVLYSALDAIRLGYAVRVVEDAVRGVDFPPGSVARAIAVMRREGAIFVKSEALL